MDTDIERASRRYAQALRSGRQTLRRGSTVELQTGRYALALEYDQAVRQTTKLVMNEIGVPSIYRFLYYGFARKLEHFSLQTGPGESLRMEVRLQIEIWVGRGLDRAVLTEIAAQVFRVHVDGPVPAASSL